MFNLSTRKVGGLRFIKIGRLTIMLCVSRRYKSLHAVKREPRTMRPNSAQPILLLTHNR